MSALGNSRYLYAVALGVLLLSSSACGRNGAAPELEDAPSGREAPAETESVVPSPEPADPTPTAAAAGLSRANPHPVSTEAISLANWEVRLLDTSRGEAAWQAIQAANQFNQPPGDGWEYLLVKLGVRRHPDGHKNAQLSIHVTGASLVTHFSFDAVVVAPKPRLDTSLPPGGESEGWKAFRIREGEGKLMLMVEDLFQHSEPRQYLALDERAMLPPAAETFAGVTATDFGKTPGEPVLYGRMATTENWQLTIKGLLVGEEAWGNVFEANQFNAPPDAGMMYLVVHVAVSYIGPDEQGVFISDSAFQVMGSSGREFAPARVVSPQPDLFFELFPGGSVDGLVVFLVPETEQGLLLVFDPGRFGQTANERRYLLLSPGGR